jgi:alkaline phosphatase
MQYELDREKDKAGEPHIADMTRAAITRLSQDQDGYILMVEGGRIDHGHHGGNAIRALEDAMAFDLAIATALEMTNPEETLIIVTADHSHTLTISGYAQRGNPILGKADVGLGLIGIANMAKDSLGLPYTTLGYMNGPGWTGNGRREFVPSTEGYTTAVPFAGQRPDLTEVDTTNPNYLQEAAIPTVGAETHAGEEVAIYAHGPRSYLFKGTMEQNAIYHVMRNALRF